MMLLTILNLLKSKGVQFILGLLLALGLIYEVHHHLNPPSPVVVEKVIHDVRTVTVEKPVLDTQTITKLVTDPNQLAASRAILAENVALRSQVNSLITANGKIETPGEVTLVTTTGRDEKGQFIGTVKLFEDTPLGRIEIPLTSKTAIFADTRSVGWHAGVRIQAGLGLAASGEKSGILAVQWLRRGKSNAAEDSKFALLTPGIVFRSNAPVELTILPVSFNLGSIPHVPFTNIWISPSVTGYNKRLGVVLSATF